MLCSCPKPLLLESRPPSTPFPNMAQHKAVEILQFNPENPASACRLATRKTPAPGPRDALIRLLCRPVNPSDLLAIQGICPWWRPESFPAVPGLEGMGVVHEVGEMVQNVHVGQRVFPLRPPTGPDDGMWQEYIVVPAYALIALPDSVSDEVAAQFVANPWTVYGLFSVLDVPKGEYVLQTAAGSVLGRMFIEYCHHQGVKTINLVRRNELKEELKALGGDEVINTNEENVVERVKEITGLRMAYGAIECVGGQMTKVVVDCVRDGGIVLLYGMLGATHVEVGIEDILYRSIKLHGFLLGTWLKELPISEAMQIGVKVMNLLEKKVISPLVGEKFPLEQFKEAIEKSLEPGHGGKVLLVSY